ncbi:MAG TPA: type II and III secretion system protein family protein [Tepidisphaeraceae bacterium]|jgi:pilus assembly protein CpaC
MSKNIQNTRPLVIKAASAALAMLLAVSPVVGETINQSMAVAVSLIESGIDTSGKLAMTVNKTAVVTTKDKYKRFSVGQPDIADVTAVGPTTLLVTGKKQGTTQIIVWNEAEQSQVIDVSVAFDSQALQDEFKRQFPDVPITVDVLNGQITLKGRVPSLKAAEQAERVAKAYAPEVMNFLEVGGGQQVMLQVQFIEVSRVASNELGFSSYFTDGQSSFGTRNGPTSAAGATLFGTGNIGGMAFEAFLSALKSNNLARTLAEPTLVAISGEDASFLAGGEIPIPVPQAGLGGASTITIEYKEFGVRLKYNAVVLGDGRIRMKVVPEVSELDYSSPTSINGQVIPGLRTRRVESIVEMNEGQTLALAGLLQRRVDARKTSTPLLGDLPIVGSLFRNVNYTRQETELVILVKPSLAQAMNPDQIPTLPGSNWKYPNEAELYGFGDLGGSVDHTGKPIEGKHAAPPRFVGPNGFDDQSVQTSVASTDSN